MKNAGILLSLLLLCLFSGCIDVNLPEVQAQATHTFDLLPLPPAETTFPYNVEILPFLSDSPAKFKMLHRKGTVLTIDEFNKWGQTPALMLTRLFRSAFTADSPAEKTFKLSGIILNFNADDSAGTAELSVKYTFSASNSGDPLFIKLLTVSEKMKNNSPEALAEAMSRAASKQISELKTIILKKIPPK